MNRTITLRDALVFFVLWQLLEGVKAAVGIPTAVGAAIAIAAAGGLGLMWHQSR